MKDAYNEFYKKRWIMLLLYSIINLCIGVLYTWSVFAIPLQEHFKTNDLAFVYTISVSVGPVTMIIGGILQQKVRTKYILFASGIMFSMGMFFSTYVAQPWQLSITYGLGCGLGAGLAYGCTVSNSVKLFPDKRGMAGGIAAATYGASSIILPPITNAMIQSMGILNSLRTLGGIFLVVVCICAGSVKELKIPVDLIPDNAETSTIDINWKEMLKKYKFYLLLALLLCGAVSGMMIISNVSMLAQDMMGASVGIAATMVSVLALFNSLGRILSGTLSDKLGRVHTLALVLTVSIAGLVQLMIAQEKGMIFFALGVMAVGFGFGAFLGIFPGFTADQFGSKYQSINYGIMFIGFAVAGMVGPSIARFAIQESHNYFLAFAIATVICAIGLALCAVLNRVVSRTRF